MIKVSDKSWDEIKRNDIVNTALRKGLIFTWIYAIILLTFGLFYGFVVMPSDALGIVGMTTLSTLVVIVLGNEIIFKFINWMSE